MAEAVVSDGGSAKQNQNIIGKREASKLLKKIQLESRDEERSRLRRIRQILRKEISARDSDDLKFLDRYSKLANEVIKKKQKQALLEERQKEKQDDDVTLEAKCSALARAIQSSKHMVVYTGAGISTAASIPDYRGPNGVWTKLSRGESLGYHSICDAEPTLTHMSLVALYQHRRIKHIVSQNCDGLHIRSGISPDCLSEVHGNMFAEVCEKCEPQRVYWRLFDVTENTGLRKHKTKRNCHFCHSELSDTIVHFGEKRTLTSPQNWEAAFQHAKSADAILCLGSSLKVLKSYRTLWGMGKARHKRPNLYIVNLQWTPKDNAAILKINGKVDRVLQNVMQKIQYEIPEYKRSKDQLFSLSIPLKVNELNTYSTKLLALRYPPEIHWKNESEEDRELNHFNHQSVSDTNCLKSADDASTDRSVRSCPGWFGKGLRKNRKKRK